MIARTVDLLQFRKLFAARVRSLRERRGLTQQDFAAYDLSWKSIQKIEYGITNPKIGTLLKLCDALGIELSELLKVGR